MEEELDKLMEGSSHTLGVYISNHVLRGEIERLKKNIKEFETQIKKLTDSLEKILVEDKQ